jgi:CheY-like chemotaxis protein
MKTTQLHLLLAEDDPDDRKFFEEALSEIPIATKFTTAADGEKLMKWLIQTPAPLPDLLFLDLNMPLKSGRECLEEIKKNPRLQSLPVIIFSTTVDFFNVENLYTAGAHYYIQKPHSFRHLVELIEQMLRLTEEKKQMQPLFQDFVISYGR